MQNQDFYRQIILDAPFAYAFHQIILDEKGKPCNYRYLEINKAFEKLTGLSATDIFGKTATEIFPDLEKSAFDWIGYYGKIALETGQEEFEQYNEFLGKWYHVNAYSTEKMFFITMFTDISERKKTELELEKEQQFARNLLDTTETILVGINNDGNITMLNRYGLSLLGYAAEDVIGKNWFRTVLPQPEGQEVVFPVFQRIISGDLESVKYFENDVINSAGERRSIAWRNSYQYDIKGKITGTLSSGIDITERIQAMKDLEKSQEAIRKQNLLFETLLENLYSGVFMVEVPGGKPLIANNAAKKLLGRGILPDTSRENLSETYHAHKPGVSDAYPVDEMPVIRGMKGEYTHVDDMIVERPDGTETWLEVFGSPVYNEKGEIWASLVNFHNISNRKKAEMALLESEEKYRTLFENLWQGIFYQASDGRAIDANEAALRMFGLTRDQFMGKTSFDPRWKVINENNDLLMPEQHPSMVALSTGKPVLNQVVGIFIPETEKYNWLIIDAIPQFKPGESQPYQVFASMQDISDRKLATDALQKSEAQLKDLNAQKDKFFSIIAHDLKSPFNAILGFSELLADQLKVNDYEGVYEYAVILQQSSQRAYDLVLNLLEWSRMQTGKKEFMPEFFELVSFMEETTPIFEGIAAQKSITIKSGLPHNLPVFADKPMISTVIRNLINNAIKFTHEGGEITLSARKDKNTVLVSVADNGVGISKTRIDRLFRFSENESTVGTANEKGSGLGLILCKEFVEKHGGRIWVESEEGKGSVFTFSIPAK